MPYFGTSHKNGGFIHCMSWEELSLSIQYLFPIASVQTTDYVDGTELPEEYCIVLIDSPQGVRKGYIKGICLLEI